MSDYVTKTNLLSALGRFKENTDDLYETKADANDLKNAIDDLEDTKADKDGYYAGLTVGNAEQLLSSALIHDQAIYTFRTAGGGEDIGNKSYQKKIVGGTFAWNQICYNGNFVDESWWVGNRMSLAVSNGKLTATALNTISASASIYQTLYTPFASGHKYLMCATVTPSVATVVALRAFGSNFVSKSFSANQKQTIAGIITPSGGDSVLYVYPNNNGSMSVNDTVVIENVMLIDLTTTFGSTIADHIKTLETANIGAGVAWFRKYFPKPYYPYTANPSLQSVCVSSKENTGFNQFDKSNVTNNSRWNGDEITPQTGYSASALITVVPNTTYYFKDIVGSSVMSAIMWMDGNKKFIKADYLSGNTEASGTKTSPPNAMYLGITVKNENLDTCCISIHWDDSRDGEYEPFQKYTYPMDSSVTLRGIPKLDANNNLYYVGDIYNSDGTGTRKYGTVTYDGSNDEIWYTYSVGGIESQYIDCPDLSLNAGSVSIANNYTNKAYAWAINEYGIFSAHNSLHRFYFTLPNSSVTPSNWRTWLASNPITIVYPLDTATPLSADPFTEEQVVDNWGTEAFTDGLTRDVFVPPMAVADYTQNLRDKLEASPSTPDADGLYLMKRENGQNTYVAYTSPIPSESTDGTYVLKATVADGAMTLAWVAEGE